MRIYLDAAPVIYLVEQVMPFAAEVSSRLSESDLVSRCDLFLTNDQRLTRFTDITVEVISGS